MLNPINSTLTKIWKTFQNKEYRDGYVDAHLTDTIASQIQILREARGWTQKDLAERTGMKQSRISQLEDPNYENITIGTLKRLATAFDVALTLRFISFSELARWVATLSPSKLNVRPFEFDSIQQTCRNSKGFIMISTPLVGASEIRASGFLAQSYQIASTIN